MIIQGDNEKRVDYLLRVLAQLHGAAVYVDDEMVSVADVSDMLAEAIEDGERE